MLTLEWPLTGPITAKLVDGSTVEGESAAVYTDGQGHPQVLQVVSKTVVSIPWSQVVTVEHA